MSTRCVIQHVDAARKFFMPYPHKSLTRTLINRFREDICFVSLDLENGLSVRVVIRRPFITECTCDQVGKPTLTEEKLGYSMVETFTQDFRNGMESMSSIGMSGSAVHEP